MLKLALGTLPEVVVGVQHRPSPCLWNKRYYVEFFNFSKALVTARCRIRTFIACQDFKIIASSLMALHGFPAVHIKFKKIVKER